MNNDFDFFRTFVTDYKTEYKVNREKGTVTCIITTTEDFMNKIIKYGFGDVFDRFGFDFDTWKSDDFDVRKYVGVAKCSPDDEWDELYGKQLAEYRAMKKRRADINKDLNDFVRRTYNNIDNLRDHGMLKEIRKPRERNENEKV